MNEDGFWGRYREWSELFFGKRRNDEGRDDNLQRSVRIQGEKKVQPHHSGQGGEISTRAGTILECEKGPTTPLKGKKNVQPHHWGWSPQERAPFSSMREVQHTIEREVIRFFSLLRGLLRLLLGILRRLLLDPPQYLIWLGLHPFVRWRQPHLFLQRQKRSPPPRQLHWVLFYIGQPLQPRILQREHQILSEYMTGVVVVFCISNGDVFEKTHDELDFEFLGNMKGKPWRFQMNVYENGSTFLPWPIQLHDGDGVVATDKSGATMNINIITPVLLSVIVSSSLWAADESKYAISDRSRRKTRESSIQTAAYQVLECDLTLPVSWLHPVPYQPCISGDHQATTSVSLPSVCPLFGSLPYPFFSHSSSTGSTFNTHLYLKEIHPHGCHFGKHTFHAPIRLGKLILLLYIFF